LAPNGPESAGEAAQSAAGIIAGAEHAGDQIRVRAANDGRRARARAAEESRAILLQARRDALGMIKGARHSADAIVAAAHREEAGLNARIRRLRRVVTETEELLASLAERGRTPTPWSGDSGADEATGDVHILVAAEQARVERRLRDGATLDPASVLPDSVRRLLRQLKRGEV
jgi:hypothetical protein